MNNIYDDLRKFNKSASDSSINMYAKNIIFIANQLGHKPEDIKPTIFKNIDDVLNLLKSQSINTQKNKLVSILVYLQSKGFNADVIEKYNNMIYSLLGKLKIQTDKNEWNDKEKKKGGEMSMDELTLLTVSLKKELTNDFKTYKDFEKYINYIIVSLCIQFPLRNDYAECKMYLIKDYNGLKDKTQFNYMVIDNDNNVIKFYINKYKTVKSYGVIEFQTKDKELNDIIYKYYINVKKYYENNNKIFEYWFLFKKDFEPMTRNYYSKYLMNVFYTNTGYKLTSNLLRKITTSDLINVKAFKNLAKIQGHSLDMAMNVYSKS